MIVHSGRNWTVLNLLAVAALSALALLGFNSSFGGWRFMVPALGGALAGIGLGWAASKLAWPALTTLAVTLAAFLLLGGPLALPETTIAGVFPSLETIRGLAEGAIAGWKQLITTAPPVGSTPPLLVVPFVTGLLGGILGAQLSLRSARPMVPLFAPVGMLAAGILVGTRFPVSVIAQGAVFGALGAAWLSWRIRVSAGSTVQAPSRAIAVRRLGVAGAMIAVAAALSIPVGPLLPFAEARPRFTLREQAEPPIDPTMFATPLGAMRKYSTDMKDETLFVVTGLPEGERLRLATMDYYDGVVWGVAGSATGVNGSSGSFERVGTQIAERPVSGAVEVTVSIRNYRDVWLPDAGQVAAVEFSGGRADELSQDLRFNRATGTGLMLQRLAEGDEYTLEVTFPSPPGPQEADQLPLGTQTTPSAASIEQVKDLQGQILAESEAEGPQSFHALAASLTSWLQENGYYSNGDAEQGRAPLVSGHGAYRLGTFTSSSILVGDEEQYAATAALMTNYSGLPTRVVMGTRAADAGQEWEVTGDDITAWIEVGMGDAWLPFDVVPSKDKPLPTNEPIKQRPQLAPQQPLPPPPPDTSEAVSASDVDPPEAEEEDGSAGGWKIPAGALLAAKLIGVPLMIAGLLIGLMVGAKALRRSRRRRIGEPSTRIAGGWDEVTGIARDFGHDLPRRGTRQEVATAFGAPTATALADQADEAVFGPDSPRDDHAEAFWSQVEQFHRDVRKQHPWHQRLRATMSIKSWRA